MIAVFVFLIMCVWIGIGYWMARREAPNNTYILDSNYIYIITLWPLYLIFASFYWLICLAWWKIEDLRR